jgi:hypothetical protein
MQLMQLMNSGEGLVALGGTHFIKKQHQCHSCGNELAEPVRFLTRSSARAFFGSFGEKEPVG